MFPRKSAQIKIETDQEPAHGKNTGNIPMGVLRLLSIGNKCATLDRVSGTHMHHGHKIGYFGNGSTLENLTDITYFRPSFTLIIKRNRSGYYTPVGNSKLQVSLSS